MSERNWGFNVRGEDTETLELDIYDVIGGSWWSDGVTAKDVRSRLKAARGAKVIKLRVNSAGGDVFDGFAIYNLLHEHPARVEADVDALAASMASIVIMAADEIRVASSALIMIHNPWALAMGDADEMRNMAELLDKIRDQSADVYAARTNLEKAGILTMMDAETWMTADEALEHGFADSIRPAKAKAAEPAAYAGLDLSGLQRVPAGLQRLVAQARDSAPRPRKPKQHSDNTAGNGGAPKAHTPKETKMADEIDIKTLRAKHPDAYEAAVQLGVKQGMDAERERVVSHLTLGEGAGAKGVEKAHAAIKAGEAMNMVAIAEYNKLSMNLRDQKIRQEETDEAAKAAKDPKPEPAPGEDLEEQVMTLVEKQLGRKEK